MKPLNNGNINNMDDAKNIILANNVSNNKLPIMVKKYNHESMKTNKPP